MKQPKMDKVVPKVGSKYAMLDVNKSSHVISKSYSASKDEGRSIKYPQPKNIIPPTIRVVYVFEPKIVKTDPQNFRSLVQRLTGKSTHKEKERKRQPNTKSPLSDVISAELATENVENIFYSNDQLPIQENKATTSLSEDWSGFSKGLNERDMIFSDLVNQGLMHEIPLVRNNSPFCNIYDQSGVYRWN